MKKLVAQIEDLKEAHARLKDALEQPKNEFLRDSVIQRFEFTFELSWKVMKTANEMLGKECASPRQCIRVSAQTAIIDNPEMWMTYLNQRNYASHIYSEPTAEHIYTTAKTFVTDVSVLIDRIEQELKAAH